MKVLNVKDPRYNSMNDNLVLHKAIKFYQEKLKDSRTWQDRDSMFEEETKAKITYTRVPGKIHYILFEDEDWFWFKARWS